jgi:hypothetical protein
VLELTATHVAAVPSLRHPRVVEKRLEFLDAGPNHLLRQSIRKCRVALVARFCLGHLSPEMILLQLLSLLA